MHTSPKTEKYIQANLYKALSKEEKETSEIWSMDFTEQKINGKKIYTCGVISTNRKIVVGIAQGKRCNAELAVKAITKAINEYGTPDLLMTDRGSAFTSKSFYDILQEKKIKHSMSRPHTPIDNVYIETFWKSMKTEIGKVVLLNEYTYMMVVEYYVYYYNNLRPHSALGYLTPIEYMRKKLSLKN